jgi:hypothetical protein
VSDAGAAIAWFNGTSEDTSELVLLTGWPAGSPVSRVIVEEVQGWPSKRAYTDFAHAVTLDHSRLALVRANPWGFGITDVSMEG